MKCPYCGGKKLRHAPGCPWEIPKVPLPPRFGGTPVAPVDPVQAHLAQIEEWAGTVNARLAALEAPAAYPDGAPPGVVSPHVRANLEALASWCAQAPGEDCEFALTRLHAWIMVALAGGDVERPPAPLPPVRKIETS